MYINVKIYKSVRPHDVDYELMGIIRIRLHKCHSRAQDGISLFVLLLLAYNIFLGIYSQFSFPSSLKQTS
ncbi:hypothetical protein BDV30DRAFT_206946 [Aspergillus minisclerotigenes]|uniref:Uncharacterized protein n=1 Tax=Aspergillus minisclerotigenes TaxID=656917 RepID=A0A5N6JAL1_9EURO|nr:hypothetical protein BDV30DRAFT_206946 [Aspergillus minisclerotigenes]